MNYELPIKLKILESLGYANLYLFLGICIAIMLFLFLYPIHLKLKNIRLKRKLKKIKEERNKPYIEYNQIKRYSSSKWYKKI